MKVYIAGAFYLREKLREAEAMLRAQQIECTSRWLYQEEEVVFAVPIAAEHERAAIREARKDFDDIDVAHAVVVDLSQPSSTGGYHVEMGYALAQDKFTIVIGDRFSIFQFLAHRHVQTWDEAIHELVEWAANS